MPIASFLLLFVPLFQDQWKDVYSESAWAERDKWQKADALIRSLEIKSGDRVADVGCHEGYMTVKLSAAVTEKGKVYAVDVEQSKLDRLKLNLQKRNIGNVEPVKGDYDDPHLPDNSLNAIVIVDTYHEMDDHDMILSHLWASLKPGGRLVLCEPIADQRRDATRADQERKHELAMNFAIEDLKKAHFNIIRREDRFVDRRKEKGDMMWIVVAVKPTG